MHADFKKPTGRYKTRSSDACKTFYDTEAKEEVQSELPDVVGILEGHRTEWDDMDHLASLPFPQGRKPYT